MGPIPFQRVGLFGRFIFVVATCPTTTWTIRDTLGRGHFTMVTTYLPYESNIQATGYSGTHRSKLRVRNGTYVIGGGGVGPHFFVCVDRRFFCGLLGVIVGQLKLGNTTQTTLVCYGRMFYVYRCLFSPIFCGQVGLFVLLYNGVVKLWGGGSFRCSYLVGDPRKGLMTIFIGGL